MSPLPPTTEQNPDLARHILTDALRGHDLPERPILIAGPTASGKSGLALALAQATGRAVINADALQVFDGWRLLTARPSAADLAQAPHHLYGHIPPQQEYSVGQWLRELTPFLAAQPAPIIVGGTGLYFNALTKGLAEIPATLPETRALADQRMAAEGAEALAAELDPDTKARVDLLNPMRVQRAWEVQHQTGRGLAAWHAQTPAPILPLADCLPILLQADRDWLNARIARRFRAMITDGALEEARAMEPDWQPYHPASKAIGVAELIAHLRGEISLEQAEDAAVIATRRYAKRQRTWFRNQMQAWSGIDAAGLPGALFQ
ncbi:MAG: tRNA (adenosine(37)-N6)-dimethylallyltransferase MiaA [Mangrovicoccus sp.]|nr:tRNA (adenosine(37)-N6)-dimethylallyltransferase MiaA [Mangrovicoccus sp.]